jgi:hypothetical protein
VIRLIASLLVLAFPAHALSCLPPDAVRLYMQAAESEAPFTIFRGRIDSARPIAVPEVPGDSATPETRDAVTRVRLTGRLLGEKDFTQPFSGEVDIRVTCLSVWCGTPVTDREILAALRMTEDIPVLEIGPCGGDSMPAEQADIEALLACHRTGECDLK